MGFCYLNSIAIAAHHALEVGCERVAIWDFDVLMRITAMVPKTPSSVMSEYGLRRFINIPVIQAPGLYLGGMSSIGRSRHGAMRTDMLRRFARLWIV
jgi:hypothetical protein